MWIGFGEFKNHPPPPPPPTAISRAEDGHFSTFQFNRSPSFLTGHYKEVMDPHKTDRDRENKEFEMSTSITISHLARMLLKDSTLSLIYFW